MKRSDLLEKLQCVAPALAPNDIVPILTHIWFTGSRVMAYNDKIGISISFKSEFKGAIPGALLISMLKTSAVENVDMTEEKGALRVKAGGLKLDLAVLPPDAFAFKMPATEKGSSLPLNANFLEALQGCMRSVGADTSDPDQLGVTIIPEKKDEVSMFASDVGTLSHAIVKSKINAKDRAILPAAFCEQLLVLTKDKEALLEDKEIMLEIHPEKNYALAIIGGVSLWGRLIASDKPRDFYSVLDKHFPEGAEKDMVPIPDTLDQILERAILLTEAEKTATTITVKSGVMEFFSRSDLHGHELHETEKVKGHPDVAILVDPRLLRAGCGHFEEMLITDRCAVMMKKNTYYLVASRGEPPKKRTQVKVNEHDAGRRDQRAKQKRREEIDDEIPF